MKKEENQKRNITVKNECDYRSRSHSPKAYLGCDTCRLKKVKSSSKLSDHGTVQDKCKLKKSSFEKDERGLKSQKIKLTDLCDEDKKRIVELIEELSKLAEKNDQLKEKLNEMQEEKQEQQDYMLKQANLFLEEKNFYVNEINEYKNRLGSLENEMKNKIFQLENHEKYKDGEITYLTKALQKALKEKNELHEHMNHLKTCLKHSLESFKKLRAEVTELQRQEMRIRKFKTTSCQTENLTFNEKHKLSSEETEEEFLSTGNQDGGKAKSSLDIINDKLEYVYQLLIKKKKENLLNSPPQKYDIDLSILLKNGKLAKEKEVEEKKKNPTGTEVCESVIATDVQLKAESEENEEKFLKPFEQCSKTLVKAERILQKIGQPLNLFVNENIQSTENKMNASNPKESTRDTVKSSNFLKNKIVQKNNLFQSSEHEYDEDQLLEELFYSDHNLNLGLKSILKLEAKDIKQNCADRPFTW